MAIDAAAAAGAAWLSGACVAVDRGVVAWAGAAGSGGRTRGDAATADVVDGTGDGHAGSASFGAIIIVDIGAGTDGANRRGDIADRSEIAGKWRGVQRLEHGERHVLFVRRCGHRGAVAGANHARQQVAVRFTTGGVKAKIDAAGCDDGVEQDLRIFGSVEIDANVGAVDDDVVANGAAVVFDRTRYVGIVRRWAELAASAAAAKRQADAGGAGLIIFGANCQVAFHHAALAATFHECEIAGLIAAGFGAVVQVVAAHNPIVATVDVELGHWVASIAWPCIAEFVVPNETSVGRNDVAVDGADVDFELRVKVAHARIDQREVVGGAKDVKRMFTIIVDGANALNVEAIEGPVRSADFKTFKRVEFDLGAKRRCSAHNDWRSLGADRTAACTSRRVGAVTQDDDIAGLRSADRSVEFCGRGNRNIARLRQRCGAEANTNDAKRAKRAFHDARLPLFAVRYGSW